MNNLVYWEGPTVPRTLRWAHPRLTRRFLRAVPNFGDRLAPQIVAGALAHHHRLADRAPSRRLLTVGSVLHMAQRGDVVWGSGKNGRIPDDRHDTSSLDIRAVRGPLTRRWLEEREVECPEVFGDPALLLPLFREDLVSLAATERHGVTFVSHIDDPIRSRRPGIHTVSPRADPEEILRALVTSRLVIATSLHAVIVAEAFGVPARSIVNRAEPEFKFADYYHATGRRTYERASSISEAIRLGGERPAEFDPGPLLAAFPLDLFDDGSNDDRSLNDRSVDDRSLETSPQVRGTHVCD